MAGEDTKLRYLPKKNPEGAAFPGVPLRDLTEDEFAAQPAHAQTSLLASSFYEDVGSSAKPAPAKRSHKKKVVGTAAAAPPENTTEGGA